MLSDLETSKKEMEKFRQQKHKGKPLGVDLTVQILNNCWDIDKNKMEKIEYIPSIIKGCMEDFTEFYIKDRNMYKLDYVFGLVIK